MDSHFHSFVHLRYGPQEQQVLLPEEKKSGIHKEKSTDTDRFVIIYRPVAVPRPQMNIQYPFEATYFSSQVRRGCRYGVRHSESSV
ncbi:hypothetical protein J6590_004487 [Homalodisca vitripennis]|nr:hypothetical protein J6590_004487 [Homalodisca vitripennis]